MGLAAAPAPDHGDTVQHRLMDAGIRVLGTILGDPVDRTANGPIPRSLTIDHPGQGSSWPWTRTGGRSLGEALRGPSPQEAEEPCGQTLIERADRERQLPPSYRSGKMLRLGLLIVKADLERQWKGCWIRHASKTPGAGADCDARARPCGHEATRPRFVAESGRAAKHAPPRRGSCTKDTNLPKGIER